MKIYLARKLGYLALVLLLVSLTVSGLLSLMPGKPASTILGNTATAKQVDDLDHQLGFYGSFLSQWIRWLGQAFTGNLGTSVITRQPVLQAIGQGLPVTLEIVLLGLLISLGVAVPLALYTARRPNGLVDTIATGVASALLSVPAFVAGVLLLYAFSVKIHLFPVGGWIPLSADPLGNLRAAVLPAFVISLGPMAAFYRILRSDLIGTLQQDFVLTARAKGMSPRYVLVRHALRPSLVTLLTTAGLTIGGLISSSFIVEVIFQVPGLGATMVQAITTKDIPIVQGVAVTMAFVYVVCNAVVDLSYAIIDPRVGAAA